LVTRFKLEYVFPNFGCNMRRPKRIVGASFDTPEYLRDMPVKRTKALPPLAFSLLVAWLMPCLAARDARAAVLPDREHGAANGMPRVPATSAMPTLGAHTLLGQENQVGTSPAVTSSLTTQTSGSSFVVFSAGFFSNATPPTDNNSNPWTLLGSPVVYHGNNNAFDVKAYVSLSGNGGNAHSVAIVKNGYVQGEITLPFIEIRNADVLHDVAQNYPSGPQLTSGSVTTTGPAVLLAFWWGDGDGLTHTALPNNGFSVIESFLNLPPLSAVQCVVASRQVNGAGTYNVTWTQSPDPGAPLWLFAFQSSETIFASGFD